MDTGKQTKVIGIRIGLSLISADENGIKTISKEFASDVFDVPETWDYVVAMMTQFTGCYTYVDNLIPHAKEVKIAYPIHSGPHFNMK